MIVPTRDKVNDLILFLEIMKVDAWAWQKKSNRHFLYYIENSFNQVTHIALEPHQFFTF